MLFGANTDGIVFVKDEDSYGRDSRTSAKALLLMIFYAIFRYLLYSHVNQT